MSIADEYLADAEFLSRKWSEAWDRGHLPRGLCRNPIGNSFIEAVCLGSIIQQLVQVEENVSMLGLTSQGKIHWARSGAPQFNLTASAAAAFVLTDVSSVRWDDVKLPFDRFVVTFPEPSPITFDDFNGHERSVRSVFVQQCITPRASVDQNAVLQRLQDAWNRRDEILTSQYAKELEEQPTLFVQGTSDPVRVPTNDQSVRFLYEGVHRYYQGHSNGDQTLADWCEPDMAPSDNWQSERSKHSMNLVCRVIASLCLYLDHSQGPERWDRDLLTRNLTKGRTRTTWDVGREIKLPKDLRDAARDLGRSDRHNTEQWALTSRKLVRGYWRNQPHGKGRAERRRQWIEPFWRGPEAADVVHSLYKVGKDGS